jgi:DNA-binding NarL/FixJ family response regulator
MDAIKNQQMKVFLVEDSAAIRSRLLELFAKQDCVRIVGEADTPQAAMAGILRTCPDYVLLDIQLLGGTGIEVLRAIHPQAPHITFIVLSNYLDQQYRRIYMDAGARFYFDKSKEFGLILDTIVKTKSQ